MTIASAKGQAITIVDSEGNAETYTFTRAVNSLEEATAASPPSENIQTAYMEKFWFESDNYMTNANNSLKDNINSSTGEIASLMDQALTVKTIATTSSNSSYGIESSITSQVSESNSSLTSQLSVISYKPKS